MSYWDMAKGYLKNSNCLRRKYAAIIVDRFGNLSSVGWNESEIGCKVCSREELEHNKGDYSECHSIHAEQMALLGVDLGELQGSELYLVCDKDPNPRPCPICQRMMDWCGVKLKEMERDD